MSPTTPAADPDEATVAAIDGAGRQMRAPWAASVAGLLFAGLFTASLVLLRNQPLVTAGDADIVDIFRRGDDLPTVVGGLYLAPFAGIMFLWFIAVIRDQLGEREDRFFATVFFGSGIIFVTLVFAATAASTVASVSVRYLGQAPPTVATVALLRAFSYTLLFGFATRAAAVFLIVSATVGLRGHVFPRWFAATGYVLGLILLVVVVVWDWIILVLPAWVAIVSLYILRRERDRRRATSRAAV